MLRNTTFLPAILLLMGAGTATAQYMGEIRGRVFDPDGGPLPGAHVRTEVSGQLFGTVTDPDGRYVLKPLPSGIYTVHISYVGMGTIEVPGVPVSDKASYLEDQRMRFSEVVKGVVEVIGHRRSLIDKDDPSRMVLLAEDIKRDPNRRDPLALVSNSFPGVTRSQDGDGLHFRGSRTENMVSFIDGVKVSGSVPRVPSSAISRVSVYTGGLPARYGDVTGGVVMLETMSYFEMYERERARLAALAEQEALEQKGD